MQIRIFTLPLTADDASQEEVNHFLRSVKVVDIRKELALCEGNNCWTFCVTYMADAPTAAKAAERDRIDYMEVLDPETFSRFSLMRNVRKAMAEKESVPAFAIFSNAELAELAKLANLTPQTMATVPGIGKKKVERYGNFFCEKMKEMDNEKTGKSDGADSLA